MLRKDFYMEIRKTMGRFISIFFIVALGVAFYSGIRASEPSMRISGDAYFDKEKLMDVKVMGTMGLTKDDINAIRSVKGVENVEGGYSKDVLCPAGDTEKAVHLISMQKDFNDIAVSKGRLPKKAGECLVDEDFLKYADYKIGDKITFRSGNEDDLKDSLTTDTFTVVGIGSSPLYISFARGNTTIGNGEVSGFIAVDQSSFHMDVYTEAYVRASDAFDETAFTAEYDKYTDAAVDALKGIKDERCKIRRQSIMDEANEELADAQSTVDEESGKLTDAREEFADAKSTAARELEAARQKLEDGQKKLEDSRKQIADGEAQIADGKKQLTAQQAVLNEKLAEYKSGAAQLKEKEEELDKGETEYLAQYAQNMPLIIAGKEEIQKQKEELAENKAKLEPEVKKLEDAIAEIVSLEQLSDGLTKTQEGIVQIEAQLTEGNKKKEEIEAKAEEERTEEDKAFLAEWQTKEPELQGQKTGLEQQLQALEQSMTDAGFASQEELQAQVEVLKPWREYLQKQYEPLNKMYQDILDGEKKLEESGRELDAQEQQLLLAGQQIADGKAAIQTAKSELERGKKQLDAGQRQIKDAWATIAEKEQTLEAGKAQLVQGEKELSEGQSEYEKAAADTAKQLSEAETKIQDGEEKLTEAKQEIADAKAEIKKIEHPKWYIQSREDALPDYSGYGENADRMRAIGKVFPAVFFLVAALISLTTMTRMVEEQRVQIGTMKALGYDKFAIAGKYIYYALLATFGGSVFGVLVGEKIFPFIIIYAYKIMYQHIPDILVPYHLEYAVKATVIAVVCTLAATVFSCYNELASQPAELMRPPSPKQGKRILLERAGWLWRKLSFIWKSSIRNLFRYKKRFFMTVFGIGGCMALMLVGFGLKDCIYEIVTIQYSKIQFYDASVYMDDNIESPARKEILKSLEDDSSVERYMQSRMQKIKVKKGKEEESLYLMVPEDIDKFKNFVSLHSRTKDETYSLEKDKVVLTEKMSQILDVKPGDKITLEDEDKGNREVTVGAVCENYMGHYLYLTPGLYEELYGASPKYNSILYMAKGGEKQAEKIGEKLLTHDDVLNITYTSSLEGRLDDMLRSLNLVIIVLIISAGMLAFVVLYNLNNINITERKRELATIKVLGFYDMEVASYVYRENILLTFIGAFAGMIIGKMLLQFVIVTVEVNEAMFGREIHWPSYLYSLLFTVGFSMFVNWVMYFKLKKIDMVESLKSVE